MTRAQKIRWASACGAGGFFLWVLGSLLISWRLSRRWTSRIDEQPPASIAARVQSTRLTTRDGEELGAWFLPTARPDAPSVAIFHGLGMSRSRRIRTAGIFEQAGCAALLVTHRCHGDSTGEREDFGWSAQLDVIAAVEWLEHTRPGAPVIVCGSSLGAAAATYAAGELGPRVAGYVLEYPYASLDLAARRRTEIYLPPVIDWIAYAGVRLGAACFAPHWSESAPVEAVRAIPPNVPVLLLAGELDQRAPPDEVAAIAANVRGPHELVILAGTDHDRLSKDGAKEYAITVRDWTSRHFATSGG